ncbi:hypothetical protein SODALDRAFT_374852 [Sodiomyces alkalinus F11]|uniref:Galactosyl transferase GMA12/MNN10 family protein n=1 Tax=Sodiomyces alkalinus (strain CBS 110278 / VKM F-3762 / F11) TaxID=1314773 RepID=A0A3N2Q799_SODAK|nr:hypothetical protein SODALDRAFT_374852 [Sodiomyces alkalinus F11]ROT42538.1 hypothetical protein SODALDRAFT_374852 [Sodiomyces alkalinus F11]
MPRLLLEHHPPNQIPLSAVAMPRPSLIRHVACKLLAVLILLFILTHIRWPFNRASTHSHGASRSTVASDSPVSLHNLHFHGQGPCLPPSASRSALLNKASSIRESCRASSPFSALLPASDATTDRGPRPRVATLTTQWGDPKAYYQKAIQTHLVHALVHETNLHLLCAPTIQAPKGAPDTLANRLEIYWNKPALVLSVLLSEMAKPKPERLDWILWADADTIILDHCRPISTFLPPELHDDDDDAEAENDGLPHLLYTNDMLGLNNGVFLLRVSTWSVNLFTAVLGFRFLRPTVDLDYLDQTAMEILIAEDPRFRARALEVPQTWFNAYADPSGPSSARGYAGDGEAQQALKLRDYHARRGDFLAHFPGDPEREASMTAWLDAVDRLGNVWASGRVQRDASDDVELFWNRWAGRRSNTRVPVS